MFDAAILQSAKLGAPLDNVQSVAISSGAAHHPSMLILDDWLQASGLDAGKLAEL